MYNAQRTSRCSEAEEVLETYINCSGMAWLKKDHQVQSTNDLSFCYCETTL